MVEPQIGKKELLDLIQKGNLQIQYINALVGREKIDNVAFYEMGTGSSVYEERTDTPRVVNYYDMKTLDSLLDLDSYDDIFLKLDVQGAEIDVLAGAKRCLSKTSFILLEASLLNYNSGAPLFAEVIDYLQKLNFVLFDICEMKRKKDQTLIQVDLLFTKSDSTIRKKVNFQI